MASHYLKSLRVAELDHEKVEFSYHEPSDTLFVHFLGRGVPGISVQLEGDLFVRVDPVTNQLLGLQIENFMSEQLDHDPRLLAFAELAGIPEEYMDRWRKRESAHATGARIATELVGDFQPA